MAPERHRHGSAVGCRTRDPGDWAAFAREASSRGARRNPPGLVGRSARRARRDKVQSPACNMKRLLRARGWRGVSSVQERRRLRPARSAGAPTAGRHGLGWRPKAQPDPQASTRGRDQRRCGPAFWSAALDRGCRLEGKGPVSIRYSPDVRNAKRIGVADGGGDGTAWRALGGGNARWCRAGRNRPSWSRAAAVACARTAGTRRSWHHSTMPGRA